MSLSQQDIERRRGFITATDVPAILGESPWVNAADVYASKTQTLQWNGNDATRAGNMLEPVVLEWAKSQLGTLIGGDWKVHEGGIIAATLDEMTAAGEPVEAKTSGIVGPGSPHQWGDEGTDQIPPYYLLQVQTQLLVTGAARAFVPALIGNRGFVMYVVNANEELQCVIQATAEAFWNEHVLPRVEPPNERPHFETLKRMLRVKGKSVTVPDELAANYYRTNELAKISNQEAESAKVALINAIGDGEVAVWSGGEFTFREQTRKSYVCEESTFRVLRAKAKKEEKCPAS